MRKIIAVILFITILLSLPVFSSFALQNIGSLDSSISTSDVLTDLEKMYFDGKKFYKLFYPHIPGADYVLLLNFFEYGYSSSSSKDYNLYLYVYNPSGKVISDSINNKIQLSVNDVYFYKYSLQLVSASDDNLFLKFKLVSPRPVYDQLSSSTRNYMISGIELLLKTPNATEFKVASQFTYTGSHANNTLYCQKDSITTISTEIHQTFYRINSSPQGQYHYSQIDSVYFALPSDLLEKYVIKSIFVEYYKQLCNFLVIDKADFSNIEEAVFSTQSGFDYWDYHLTTMHTYTGFDDTPASWNYFRSNSDAYIPFIMAAFYQEDRNVLLDRDDILSEIYEHGSLSFYADFEKSDKFAPVHSYKKVEFDDVFSAIPYSERQNWLSQIWEYGLWDWITTDYDDAVNCTAIDVFNYHDLNLVDSELSKKYVIDLSDVLEFREYAAVCSAESKDIVFFRFDTQDYYCDEVDIGVGDDPFYDILTNTIFAVSDGYYAEEYGYFDLDIVSAEFEDEAGVITNIPFVSSPVDVIGSGESPDSANKSEDQKAKEGEWKRLIAIIMLALALILVIWVIGKVAPRRYRVTGGSSGRRRRRR